MKLNKHYSELNESYLFSTIAHKVAAYQKANPDKDIIRLGIGDVTLPLAKSVTDAMLKAVEEQGKKETFHGYIPSEQGYEFLRSAIQKYYAGHGVELDMAEIFVSDGAKSDLGNLLDLFDVDNTVLVPDPVYPVYVDDNVMAGRKILYMSASAENNFLPMPAPAVRVSCTGSALPSCGAKPAALCSATQACSSNRRRAVWALRFASPGTKGRFRRSTSCIFWRAVTCPSRFCQRSVCSTPLGKSAPVPAAGGRSSTRRSIPVRAGQRASHCSNCSK